MVKNLTNEEMMKLIVGHEILRETLKYSKMRLKHCRQEIWQEKAECPEAAAEHRAQDSVSRTISFGPLFPPPWSSTEKEKA